MKEGMRSIIYCWPIKKRVL